MLRRYQFGRPNEILSWLFQNSAGKCVKWVTIASVMAFPIHEWQLSSDLNGSHLILCSEMRGSLFWERTPQATYGLSPGKQGGASLCSVLARVKTSLATVGNNVSVARFYVLTAVLLRIQVCWDWMLSLGGWFPTFRRNPTVTHLKRHESSTCLFLDPSLSRKVLLWCEEGGLRHCY
jgi:hypothetical protein